MISSNTLKRSLMSLLSILASWLMTIPCSLMLFRFYGEDPNTTSPEDFFSLLYRFHVLVDNARANNLKEKEEQEKRLAAALKEVCTLLWC
jgi:hypothetical protein